MRWYYTSTRRWTFSLSTDMMPKLALSRLRNTHHIRVITVMTTTPHRYRYVSSSFVWNVTPSGYCTTDRRQYYYLAIAATLFATVGGLCINVANSNAAASQTSNTTTTTTPLSHNIVATSPSEKSVASKHINPRDGNIVSISPPPVPTTTTTTTTTTTMVEYDFIVIGYGIAGRSAVATLQQQCPNATIAVIDPFLPTTTTSPTTTKSSQRNRAVTQPQQQQPLLKSNTVTYYPESRVTEFDPTNKECVVVVDRNNNCTIKEPTGALSSSSRSEYSLSYRHAILIATGSRGAPIPTYLIDDKAKSRTYEYRSTIPPPDNDIDNTLTQQQHKQQRPITSQNNIHQFVRRQADSGAAITVLGSGWDAIDLIASASSSSKRRNNNYNNDPNGIAIPNTLIFGSYGPVSHILPNYLSVEITKRLQSRRITILDRSLVRYISFIGDRNKTSSQQQSQLQVYTAKSYDFLDGKAIQADYIVVAPDVYGARGTAAFPTSHIPSFLQDDTHNHTSWYHTWSSLTMIDDDDDNDDTTTLLSCYKDDGRILVNTELYACHGVFAAGSVAKYPNGRNGNAMVAGCGVTDGSNAGYVAAMNMTQIYNRNHNNTASNFDGFVRFGRGKRIENREPHAQSVVKDPIPIWRSDLRSVSTSSNDQSQELSSLEDIGIVALCVGNCDAESLATHGVWWTNHAAHRRLAALAEMNDTNGGTEKQRRKMKQSFKPIYGFGVVFYLDRSNKIQGVMTWGLPFYKSDKNRQLNEEFIAQIKQVIKTNGEFRTIESEQDRIEFTGYLGKVSKELIECAFSNHGSSIGTNHRFDGKLEHFPRPLHRYTEIRPPNVRVVGLLKRNDNQNQGILGQDLFVRFEQDDTPDNPIPLPLAENLGSAIAKVQAQYDWDVWEQVERRWDENESRARPSKEDPLWIRKGDEGRATSSRENLALAYSKAFTRKQ